MHATKSVEDVVYVLASVGDTVLGTVTIITLWAAVKVEKVRKVEGGLTSAYAI